MKIYIIAFRNTATFFVTVCLLMASQIALAQMTYKEVNKFIADAKRGDMQAVEQVRQAAQDGDIVAQTGYGMMFKLRLINIPQKPGEVSKWTRQAVESGEKSAMRNIAFLYSTGEEEFPVSKIAALAFYITSEKLGNKYATEDVALESKSMEEGEILLAYKLASKYKDAKSFLQKVDAFAHEYAKEVAENTTNMRQEICANIENNPTYDRFIKLLNAYDELEVKLHNIKSINYATVNYDRSRMFRDFMDINNEILRIDFENNTAKQMIYDDFNVFSSAQQSRIYLTCGESLVNSGRLFYNMKSGAEAIERKEIIERRTNKTFSNANQCENGIRERDLNKCRGVEDIFYPYAFHRRGGVEELNKMLEQKDFFKNWENNLNNHSSAYGLLLPLWKQEQKQDVEKKEINRREELAKSKRKILIKNGNVSVGRSCKEIAEAMDIKMDDRKVYMQPDNINYVLLNKLIYQKGQRGTVFSINALNGNEYGAFLKFSSKTLWFEKNKITLNDYVLIAGRYIDNDTLTVKVNSGEWTGTVRVYDVICIEPGTSLLRR